MSAPITSVTENRVTVTANDTEANIRAAAGFSIPEPETKPDASEKSDPEAGEAPKPAATTSDRNPDGTFKAKAEDATPKQDGDPRKSHQAKINAAIAKQRDAERRAEDAERRAAEREVELQALRQPKASSAAPLAAPVAPQPASGNYLQQVQRYQAEPNAPKFDDFVAAGVDDPYGAHQAAMAAYIADRRLEEREARVEAARAQRESDAAARNAWDIARQAHPDFEDHLKAHTVQYSDTVLGLLKVEAALDPHLSADLTYYLLTHPDDAEKLGKITHPIAAAREIGRLTASLSSAQSGPETAPTQTTAKPLIKPVRTSVMAAESSPPDDLPFGAKYIAAMNEQERKAREARRA